MLAAHLYDAEQRGQVRACIADTGISMRRLAGEIGFSDYRLRPRSRVRRPFRGASMYPEVEIVRLSAFS